MPVIWHNDRLLSKPVPVKGLLKGIRISDWRISYNVEVDYDVSGMEWKVGTKEEDRR
jgi:hypothetical protein